MPVHALAEIRVHYPALFSQYLARVPAIVERHHGRYLSRGGKGDTGLRQLKTGSDRHHRVSQLRRSHAVLLLRGVQEDRSDPGGILDGIADHVEEQRCETHRSGKCASLFFREGIQSPDPKESEENRTEYEKVPERVPVIPLTPSGTR